MTFRSAIPVFSLLLVLGCSASAPTRRAPAETGRDPAQDGQWTPAVQLKDLTQTFPGTHERPRPDDGWWVTSIHSNLLADGRVLITGWSRSTEQYCPNHKGRQNGTTFVLDPASLDVAASTILPIQPVSEEPKVAGDVMYCTGHTPTADGRVLFTGGARYTALEEGGGAEQEYGLNYARIYDPAKNAMSLVGPTSPAGPHPTAEDRAKDWGWYEQGMMWYPTNTRLPDGRVLVAGGFARQHGPFDKQYYNKSLALFDLRKLDRGEDPWSVLVSDEVALDVMDIGPFDYPHTFLLPKPIPASRGLGHARQVVVTGGAHGAFGFLSLDAGVPEKERLVTLPDAHRPASKGRETALSDTTAALLPTGEILVAGGGANGPEESARIDVYNPYTGVWRTLDTGITRIRAASTLLPDGTALILSGEAMWDTSTVGDRRQPTIYDPATGSFRNLAAWSDDASDRGYHNTAVLLKDGRVLVGGGRTLTSQGGVEEHRIGCERTDLRIFSPPYLFKGARPVIQGLTEGQRIPALGKPFKLRYSGPAPRGHNGVVLMALGSETHHFDQNQRYVSLDAKAAGKGVLAVRAPKDSLVAPPGDYLLFIVSEQGVPSVARTVRITASR